MRKFLLIAVAASIALLFSCNPCNNLDCAANNYYAHFRIVNANTGTDLVFGQNRIYNKNQIRFYSLKGTDTTFFDYQPIKLTGTGYDSVLYVLFYPRVDVAYMRLSNGDIDTLNIFYNATDTKCCGTITNITSFKYNNIFDISGGRGTQELKK